MQNRSLPPSAALYNRAILSIYDAYVLGFSNTFAWRCPSNVLLSHYNQNVSDRHLDIGPGTGYFLDHCEFPSNHPRIDLLDINESPLELTMKRISRYNPTPYIADITTPFTSPEGPYSSIALNYILHCLPGTIQEKGTSVLAQLIPMLDKENGSLFGSTILNQGVQHNQIGSILMRVYNSKGVFGNLLDSEEELRQLLNDHFARHTLEIRGCVALFVGYMI